MKKKDQEAIARLYTEGYDNETGTFKAPFKGPEEGGRYPMKTPESLGINLKKIRRVAMAVSNLMFDLEDCPQFKDLIPELQNFSIKIGKYAGSFSSDDLD